MKTRPTTPLTPAQRDALEARFALRVSARLNEGAAALPHDITERLRVAREQAVRARAPQAVPVTRPVSAPVLSPVTTPVLSPAGLSAGGTGAPSMIRLPVIHGVGRDHGRKPTDTPVTWGWRLAAAVPVLALLAGLWGIQTYFRAERVQAATEVDVELLKDELPPAAYADPGFAEFLRSDASASPVRPIDTDAVEPDGDLKTEDANAASATP